MGDADEESIVAELPTRGRAGSSVDDITLSCAICLMEPKDVRLCKQCAKLFCRICLEKSYGISRRCPHCRGNFPLDAYVRVPWVSELLENVDSLPLKIAEQCPQHSRNYLVNYCNGCDKSCCATCWINTHLNHNVCPIELANNVKRTEIHMVLYRLRDYAEGLIQSRRLNKENWLAQEAWFRVLKREGDALMEECPKEMKEKWTREMERMASPETVVATALKRAHTVAASIKSAAGDWRLNRLVDGFESLRGQAERAIEGKDVAEVLAFYESVHDWDVLENFLPYLPGWDVKETVTMKNCLHLLKSRDQCRLAQWTVNGITWSLWIADRYRHKKSPEDQAKMHPVGRLSIYVTMSGRKELRNYALRLDKVQQSASIDKLPVRAEIVCRDTFHEGEKMYFTIGTAADWINDDGHLVVNFKVRPLDYRQKCLDQEVYFRSLLGPKSGRDNVEPVEMVADGVPKDSRGTSRFLFTFGQPESVASAIHPEANGVPKDLCGTSRISFTFGKPKSVTSAIQPKTAPSTIQPEAVTSAIQSEAVTSAILPKSVPSASQPESATSAIQPEAVTSTIQPKATGVPNDLCGTSRPSFAFGHPKSVTSAIQP